MRLAARTTVKPRREPTIALINIVFLMLVFFMVAGTLAQPLDPGLELVNTENLDGRAPPDALVMHADGHLAYRGQSVPDAAQFLARLDDEARETIRILPDRNVDAAQLVELGRGLTEAGVKQILIVTERGLR